MTAIMNSKKIFTVESPIDFPISPYRDPDERMAVIGEDDAHFLANFLLTALSQTKAVFYDAPTARHLEHSEMDKAVRSAIAGLVKLKELSYQRLVVMSIIG